jgi:hypothetical protein
MSAREPRSVDLWRDYPGEYTWAISLCDDEGEIQCLGGGDDEDDAWSRACEYADEHGVPARQRIGDGSTHERDYEPEVRR